MEFIAAVLGEICCQIVFAALADTFVGVAGYKTYKKRKQARKSALPKPPPDAWSRAFWILLPLGIVLTLFVIVTAIARHTR